jgi:hypothetical protein
MSHIHAKLIHGMVKLVIELESYKAIISGGVAQMVK